LLNAAAAERLLERVRPELMLDLAWYSEHGRFWTSMENLRWVDATSRLMFAFARAGGRRAVLVGTCAEYEWGSQTLHERDTPLLPTTLYGASKHATHVVSEALARQLDARLAWGRLFFLYGPHEHRERLVASVTRGLVVGERVATTSGSQVLDFMHVDDAGRALVALLESEVTGAVNVASGVAVSVREVVATIGELTGRLDHVDFGAIESRLDEPSRIVADVGRLRDEVAFKPAVSLRDGLAATVEWWRERLARG
jgi:nucleoside-diphosphate-sugar epimerase